MLPLPRFLFIEDRKIGKGKRGDSSLYFKGLVYERVKLSGGEMFWVQYKLRSIKSNCGIKCILIQASIKKSSVTQDQAVKIATKQAWYDRNTSKCKMTPDLSTV